ncbi:MAG TPA: lysophospholipid acyltransferase family protein [Candidatus Cloacimonadota bacterium]|nr:lysophospholipid acyltransferase family protein [Candidatus Cloacimonadota bacterium]
MLKKIFFLIWHLWMTLDFFVSASLIKLITPDLVRRRQRFIRNNHRVAKGYLKAFRIKTTIQNPERLELFKDKNYLVVANHVSYTDIMVLSSIRPFSFITSVEMGSNPFLGDITRLGGSLYTNRKKFVSLPAEIENFAEALRQGFNVVLFAEGTSTDGSDIRPFRSSLFEMAIKSQADILPVCINYTTINGEPRSEANRDILCWYGDMSFAPHFWRLLGHKITAKISILEPIACTTQTKRQSLSNETYERIRAEYLGLPQN